MTSTDELGPVLSEAVAAMEDGVAVFAEDGALVFANAHFSALAERLGGGADVRAYADLCAAPGAVVG